MTDITTKVRERYGVADLTNRIKFGAHDDRGRGSDAERRSACSTRPVPYLGHPRHRGIGRRRRIRVIDPGVGSRCGISGPARYLAATFGCKVTGCDLSPGFNDAAASADKGSF